jgi:hypothetical protein
VTDTAANPTSASASSPTKINPAAKKPPSSISSSGAKAIAAGKTGQRARGLSPAVVIGGIVAAVFVIVTLVVVVLMSLGGDEGGSPKSSGGRPGANDTSANRALGGGDKCRVAI